MPVDLIAAGQPAPDFSLPATTGASPLGLGTLRGKNVVMAFFPLAFTDT